MIALQRVLVHLLVCMAAEVPGSCAHEAVRHSVHTVKDPEPLDALEEHPKMVLLSVLVGELPKPWDIAKIQPEIIVFGRGREKMVVSHSMDERDAVSSLEKDGFLSPGRIVFVTHGFLSSSETEWLHKMKDAMLAERDQTVAIVGWGRGSDIGVHKYSQAAANALAVGKWLAKYVAQVRERRSDIYIWGVGHSLGAHLMGNAGRACSAFDRVTGLDPAGPGFQDVNQDRRLRRSDAKLVDVIHTDGKRIPYFGTLVPLGSIDFYPNYGWAQPLYSDMPEKPPCTAIEYAKSSGESADDADLYCMYGTGFTVSHSRAIDYFTWSIQNKGRFVTSTVLDGEPTIEKTVERIRQADGKSEMGYHADDPEYYRQDRPSKQMCYFLVTNAQEPWS